MDLDSINRGFSQEARGYDQENELNSVIRWARSLVREAIVKYVPRESAILEINAGTGIDAKWLVDHGYRVHATDIAEGMLSAIRGKIHESNVAERFTVQNLSFTELERADHAPFDAVFSNFGGLNCCSDLSLVVSGLKKVLKPGGWVIWVFMPPACPWELAEIFRGRIKTALRRFTRGGVFANVGGVKIRTHYFTARQVERRLGSDFKVVHLQSFSLFCPPMNRVEKVGRFPRLLRFLMRLDEQMGRLPVFNQCGDFLILIARHVNSNP
jgi:ubiquinone/menaquinone biosynthesis C-methylase UbiE